MNAEDIKHMIRQRMMDQRRIHESHREQGIPISPWSFGYVTALQQAINDIEYAEQQEFWEND